jgi:FlaA1/EpsC-like NDP-sugar epimerase
MQHRVDMPGMEELFGEEEPQAEPSDTECSLPKKAFRGEAVLVTGAAGSLGRALASRLAELPLEGLLLLDTSEHGLASLKEDLEGERLPQGGPDRGAIQYLLADLRIEADRRRALRAGPTAVIHAAAYKHVPFLETRPIAAAQNNLLATADWLRACRAVPSIDRFTFVSTDKAVSAKNAASTGGATARAGVMAQTKAACERMACRVRQSATAFETTTARLCNVFGSRGSVVPRFCRRLREGRSLPVTDPEMERRFIGPEAAANAVLWASVQEGATYVPRAGRRVRVGELARRLVERTRPEAAPDEWIEEVGPRPGETRRERLLAASERPAIPAEGGLLRAREASDLQVSRNGQASQNGTASPTRQPSTGPLRDTIEKLRRTCRAGDEAAVRRLLREVATRPQAGLPE